MIACRMQLRTHKAGTDKQRLCDVQHLSHWSEAVGLTAFLPHPLSLAPVGRRPTGVLAKGFGHSLLARPVVGYCKETLKTRGVSAETHKQTKTRKKKTKKTKTKKNLNPQGRTPPLKRLTCTETGWRVHVVGSDNLTCEAGSTVSSWLIFSCRPCSKPVDCRARAIVAHYFERFLDRTKPRRSEAERTILPG